MIVGLFENYTIFQLQQILRYHNVRATPYRPQGHSVSECLHGTLHSMLAIYYIKQRNGVILLPFLQPAYNSLYSSAVKETLLFLMFGRQPRLPVVIVFGIQHVREHIETHDFLQKNTRELMASLRDS